MWVIFTTLGFKTEKSKKLCISLFKTIIILLHINISDLFMKNIFSETKNVVKRVV